MVYLDFEHGDLISLAQAVVTHPPKCCTVAGISRYNIMMMSRESARVNAYPQ